MPCKQSDSTSLVDREDTQAKKSHTYLCVFFCVVCLEPSLSIIIITLHDIIQKIFVPGGIIFITFSCHYMSVSQCIPHLTAIHSCDVSCNSCRKSEHILIGGCISVCHSLSHAVCCPINSQCITILGPGDSGSRRVSGGAGQGS